MAHLERFGQLFAAFHGGHMMWSHDLVSLCYCCAHRNLTAMPSLTSPSSSRLAEAKSSRYATVHELNYTAVLRLTSLVPCFIYRAGTRGWLEWPREASDS